LTPARLPGREAAAAILLLLLACAAVLLAPARPGPGPLALQTAVAAVHAALLGPSIGRGPARWGLLPVLLALPALCATSYGAPGAWPVPGAVLLVGLASLAGASARALKSPLYLPSMLLVFFCPYALHYLVAEFGGGDPGPWRLLSPCAAAGHVAKGGAPPAPCVLLLLAWPVWALARRGRA